MSNRGNRFKKIGFKLKNFSSKVDDFVLGPDFNSKSSDKNDDFSNLDHIIVPEHNEGYIVEDFSGSRDSSPLVNAGDGSSLILSGDGAPSHSSLDDSSLLDDGSNNGFAYDLNGSMKNNSNEKFDSFNKFSDDLNKQDAIDHSFDLNEQDAIDHSFDLNEQDAINNSFDDELESKYSKYLNPELDDSKESYLNELNFGENPDDLGNSSKDGGFTYSDGHFNSRYHDSIKGHKPSENLNYSDSPFEDGIALDSRFSDGISDGLFNEEVPNENSGVKDSLKKFKSELLKKDDKSKNRFGKIAFVLIFLVLASSMLYFMVYQPFQEELNLEKNAKLNELNALYKGPLEVHENAYALKNQIESTHDIEELKSIDVLRTATDDWKTYQKSCIVKSRDDYGRVMLSYADNDTKNVILSVVDAQDFVKDNDAKVLSNVRFRKVDTVIVPISLSRLQATAGLIYVGSIVDIYSLDENDTFDYSQTDSNSDEISVESQDNSSENLSNDSSVPVSQEDMQSSTDSMNVSSGDENLDSDKGPDVSGATVLAILRSKESGVVDSKFSRSSLKVNGNVSTPKEKTNSFSTDVEELLKASAFGSYSGNGALESYLDSYGVKLSDYERMSNLGELDSEYIILLEVPRNDVDFIINNMDDLILTIPTQFAPNWVADELSQTYYEALTTPNNETLF